VITKEEFFPFFINTILIMMIFVGIDPISKYQWNQIRCIKMKDAEEDDFVYYGDSCDTIPIKV
jgi:hypothetical protein